MNGSDLNQANLASNSKEPMTSNCQLQDGGPYRSPCETLQQLSQGVRKLEEEISSLRMNNFRLKLRLYFTEQAIPGDRAVDTQESLSKELTDIKVDSENLRKALLENQNQLKEAAMAFGRKESLQQQTVINHQKIVYKLEQEIEHLNTRELDGHVTESDNRIAKLKDQIAQLNNAIRKRDETIKEYEDKITEVVIKNAHLLDELEAIEETQKIKNANLKDDNIHLVSALMATQDNFRKETIQMKACDCDFRSGEDDAGESCD